VVPVNKPASAAPANIAFIELLIFLLLLRIDFASQYSNTRSQEKPKSPAWED
jgi:hypothetical protein